MSDFKSLVSKLFGIFRPKLLEWTLCLLMHRGGGQSR
jgi:hypothetical protein